jgi:hypothetical protein
MNKGTKIRTALRIAFSIYTAFCMWQVSIGKLSEQLNAPWLVALCAIVIVASGIIVDVLTTYYNNDYTEVAAKHTGEMRQEKLEQEEKYVGDYFYTNEKEVEPEENLEVEESEIEEEA